MINLFVAHFIFFLLNILTLSFIYLKNSKKLMPGIPLSIIGLVIAFFGNGTFEVTFFLSYFSIPLISRILIWKYPGSEEAVIRLNNTTLILLVLGLLINSFFTQNLNLPPSDIQSLVA